MMKAVDRALAAAHAIGDLPGGEAGHVAQEHHFPLLGRECREGRAHRLGPIQITATAELGVEDGLGRHQPVGPQLIDRDVASEAEQPGEERNTPVVVLGDCGDQLGEHVLGDILSLVLVTDDRPDVAVDVLGVDDVQETDGVPVALLGPSDGQPDLREGLWRPVDRRPAAKADRRRRPRRKQVNSHVAPRHSKSPRGHFLPRCACEY